MYGEIAGAGGDEGKGKGEGGLQCTRLLGHD